MTPGQLFDLSGRVALVTGGSRGLGLAMARALGGAGAAVAIAARKADELDAARAELGREGIHVTAHRADLSDMAAAAPLVDEVLAAHGRLDVLVNNAGASWGAPAEAHPHEAWRKVVGINLDGVFALSQAAAAKAMLPAGAGSIVIVSSIAGLAGGGEGMNAAAYHASKAGAINLARALAGEWGSRGVRVNALCPGWFPTKMSRGLLAAHEKAMLARVPMGRFGEPDADLAGPVLFLASNASRFVTGAVLAVDGGQSAAG